MSDKTYYEILSIDPNATQAEINAKYRSIVKNEHPNKVKDRTDVKQINEASEKMKMYSILLDEDQRKRYDEKIKKSAKEPEESEELTPSNNPPISGLPPPLSPPGSNNPSKLVLGAPKKDGNIGTTILRATTACPEPAGRTQLTARHNIPIGEICGSKVDPVTITDSVPSSLVDPKKQQKQQQQLQQPQQISSHGTWDPHMYIMPDHDKIIIGFDGSLDYTYQLSMYMDKHDPSKSATLPIPQTDKSVDKTHFQIIAGNLTADTRYYFCIIVFKDDKEVNRSDEVSIKTTIKPNSNSESGTDASLNFKVTVDVTTETPTCTISRTGSTDATDIKVAINGHDIAVSGFPFMQPIQEGLTTIQIRYKEKECHNQTINYKKPTPGGGPAGKSDRGCPLFNISFDDTTGILTIKEESMPLVDINTIRLNVNDATVPFTRPFQKVAVEGQNRIQIWHTPKDGKPRRCLSQTFIYKKVAPAAGPAAGPAASPSPIVDPDTQFTSGPSPGNSLAKFAEQSTFLLDGKNTTVSSGDIGAIHDIKGFSERFVLNQPDLEKVKTVFLRYWFIRKLGDTPISISEDGSYRMPCNLADIKIMKDSFGKYKEFLIGKGAEKDDRSMQEDAYNIELEKVNLYLISLNGDPKIATPKCISIAEANARFAFTKGPEGGVGNYTTFLPHMLYLAYKQTKEGGDGAVLNADSIFDEYPEISGRAVDELLGELEKDGTLSDNFQHNLGAGILRLMKFLYDKYPKVYYSVIPKGTNNIQMDTLPPPNPNIVGGDPSVYLQEIDLDNLLEDVNEPEIVEAIRKYMSEIEQAYHDNHLSDAANSIKELIGTLLTTLNEKFKKETGIPGQIEKLDKKIKEMQDSIASTDFSSGMGAGNVEKVKSDLSKLKNKRAALQKQLDEGDTGLKQKIKEIDTQITIKKTYLGANEGANKGAGDEQVKNEINNLLKQKFKLLGIDDPRISGAPATATATASATINTEVAKKDAEIATLKKKVAELESDDTLSDGSSINSNQELTDKLSKAEAALKACQNAPHENEAGKAALAAAQAAKTKAEADLAACNQEKTASAAKISELEDLLTKAKTDLQTKNRDADAAATAKQAELDNMRSQQDEATKHAATIEAELAALKAAAPGATVGEKDAEIGRLTGELTKAAALAKDIDTRLSAATAAASQTKAATDAAAQAAAAKILQLQTKLDTLNKSVNGSNGLNAQITQLTRLLADATTSSKTKDEDLEKANKVVADLQAQIAALSRPPPPGPGVPSVPADDAQMTALRAQLAAAAAKAQAAEDALRTSQTTIDSLNAEIAACHSAEDELARLRGQKAGFEAQIAALEAQLHVPPPGPRPDVNPGGIDPAAQELEGLRKQLNALTPRLAAAEANAASLTTSLASKEAELKRIQEASDKARDAATAEIRRLNEELAKALASAPPGQPPGGGGGGGGGIPIPESQQIKDLRSQLAAAEAALTGQQAGLVAQVKQLTTEAANLTAQLAAEKSACQTKINAAVAALQAQVTTLTAENANLSRSLNTLLVAVKLHFQMIKDDAALKHLASEDEFKPLLDPVIAAATAASTAADSTALVPLIPGVTGSLQAFSKGLDTKYAVWKELLKPVATDFEIEPGNLDLVVNWMFNKMRGFYAITIHHCVKNLGECRQHNLKQVPSALKVSPLQFQENQVRFDKDTYYDGSYTIILDTRAFRNIAESQAQTVGTAIRRTLGAKGNGLLGCLSKEGDRCKGLIDGTIVGIQNLQDMKAVFATILSHRDLGYVDTDDQGKFVNGYGGLCSMHAFGPYPSQMDARRVSGEKTSLIPRPLTEEERGIFDTQGDRKPYLAGPQKDITLVGQQPRVGQVGLKDDYTTGQHQQKLVEQVGVQMQKEQELKDKPESQPIDPKVARDVIQRGQQIDDLQRRIDQMPGSNPTKKAELQKQLDLLKQQPQPQPQSGPMMQLAQAIKDGYEKGQQDKAFDNAQKKFIRSGALDQTDLNAQIAQAKRNLQPQAQVTPEIAELLAAAAAAAAERKARGYQHGGAHDEDDEDVKYSPKEFEPLIRHQYAWDRLNDHYQNLTPEYKKILPKPPKAPVLHAIKPFQKYIEENGENGEDPEALTEARDAVDMLPPHELEELMKPTPFNDDDTNEDTPMSRIKPYYEKALPGVGTPWVPIMVRADVLSRILKDRTN